LTALGADLSNVTTLTVGFERAGAIGGTGTVLLDEIRLYPSPPVVPAGLVIDVNFKDPVNRGGELCPQKFLM
jgi:hypothetical protein